MQNKTVKKTDQIKPAHGDGDGSNLPLPALPDSCVKGAIVEIENEKNCSYVTNPLHQVFDAEI